jgi:hypothetical protein
MGCGCGGKKKGVQTLLAEAREADGKPETWGPPLWAILHILAGRIGKSGTPFLDTDQARDMEVVISMLPLVIPCAECQAHCRAYLAKSPFTCIKLTGGDLSACVRTWLLDFHNAVRSSNGQAIEVADLEALDAVYKDQTIQSCQIESFGANVLYGIRNGLVKMDSWKRWISVYKRLKVLLGA